MIFVTCERSPAMIIRKDQGKRKAVEYHFEMFISMTGSGYGVKADVALVTRTHIFHKYDIISAHS